MSTWIKLLDSLHEDPRVFRMGELLAKTAQSYILAPTSDLLGPVTNTVTRNALRDVTVAGLSRVWRAANRHTTDGVFRHATLDYLDTLAQIPGFGGAMAAVGYALHDPAGHTVTLPRFAEHNAPDKNGERGKTANAKRQERCRKKKLLLMENTRLELEALREEQALRDAYNHTLRNAQNNVIPSISSSLSISESESESESESQNPNPTPTTTDHTTRTDQTSGHPCPSEKSVVPPLALSLDDLKRRINHLRPKTWGKMLNWSAEDEAALFQTHANLQLLDPQDWLILEWFMRWANTSANTASKDPVRVTSKRHTFVADISSYLDRATAAWKQSGSPKLSSSSTGNPARSSGSAPADASASPSEARRAKDGPPPTPELPPEKNAEAFGKLLGDYGIQRNPPAPHSVTTNPERSESSVAERASRAPARQTAAGSPQGEDGNRLVNDGQPPSKSAA